MFMYVLVALLANGCVSSAPDPSCSYFYETLPHGKTFRNAKDFGAKGDGQTDDTAAIQRAFDYQQQGGDGSNVASSPAIVYLPPGTYRVTDTLVIWFWGHMIGNPLCPPTLLLPPTTPGFSGVGGMKPLLTASLGFNISVSHHAWWVQNKTLGGHANDLFYVQIHHLRIVVGAGNGGAVGILFPVAQQTSIRDVSIDMSASGAIGIDFQGGADYNVTYPFGASVGGGGSVEDVAIQGGGVGMRLSGSQWTYRGVTITGSTTACLSAQSMAWSHTLVAMNLSHCPVAIRSEINGLGALLLLDSSLGPGLGPTAIDTSGSQGGLYLQSVRVVDPGATPNLVDGVLATPPLGLLHSWGSPAMAASYSGVGVNNGGGYLPLPLASKARAAGVAFACTGISSSSPSSNTSPSPTLCGGSDEDPSTGLATGATPRPTFVGLAFVSATAYGAVGDGEADDTAALQAGLASGQPLFLPSGTYRVSDTLHIPCNGTLLGEGLATIALAPNAPGFGGGGGLKAMLATPPSTPSSPCYAHLADLSLSTLGPGNMGALLLNHTSNSDSGLWDVTIRVYGYGVGLKAHLGPPTPGDPSFSPDSGGGVLSNAWWWVADHNLTDLLPMSNGTAPPCTSHCSAGQELGVVVTTGGPLFLLGTNFEHSGQLEYNFTGASNVVGSCVQTEGSTTSVLVDGCGGKGPVVLFGTVFGSGTGGGDNKTLHTTRGKGACVQAGFDAGEGSSPPNAATIISLDLSFRILGSMQRLQKNLIVDDAFYIPANATERWDMASIYKTC